MSLRSPQITLDQCHSGRIKLEEFVFITDFTILFQSTHFTRAAKGQEIQADLRSYQLTPPAPPSPFRTSSLNVAGNRFSWKIIFWFYLNLWRFSRSMPCLFHCPTQPNPRIPSSFLRFNSCSLFLRNVPRNKIPLAGSHSSELPSLCFPSSLPHLTLVQVQTFISAKVSAFSSSKPICNGGTINQSTRSCRLLRNAIRQMGKVPYKWLVCFNAAERSVFVCGTHTNSSTWQHHKHLLR